MQKEYGVMIALLLARSGISFTMASGGTTRSMARGHISLWMVAITKETGGIIKNMGMEFILTAMGICIKESFQEDLNMEEASTNTQLEMSTKVSTNTTSDMAKVVFASSTAINTKVSGSGIVTTEEGNTTSTSHKPSLVNLKWASSFPTKKYSQK